MTMPVHVVSFGARTPLGPSAASAAAVRAGVNAAGLHPFLIDQSGDRMPAARDPEIEPRLIGPARFLALAESALCDVMPTDELICPRLIRQPEPPSFRRAP